MTSFVSSSAEGRGGAPADVLVIGAGLAGLAFAGDAARAGLRVRVVDKARGPGGRASTKRFEGGAGRADHGAQYFTARGERLRALAEAWTAEGGLRAWSHGFPVWDAGSVQPRPAGHPRYAPTDGMNALPKRLADGLNVTTGTRIARLERDAATGIWTATADDGRTFAARRVVLNMPPAQIIPLVAADSFVDTAPLARVTFWPTWAVIFPLETDLAGADWPALEVRHPVLAWLSRDHTKRANPLDAPPVLVAHPQGHWSVEHLEDDPADVVRQVRAAVEEVAGQPLVLRGEAVPFRWRYSQPIDPYPAKHFFDPDLGLGWCGDWCGGPKVEGALTSGWSLAEAMLAQDAAE